MVDVVAAAAVWSAAAWPALWRASAGPCDGCRAREREWTWLGRGWLVILWSGPRRPAMLAACDPSIVEWTVLATTSMVQDVFWLAGHPFPEFPHTAAKRFGIRFCRCLLPKQVQM